MNIENNYSLYKNNLYLNNTIFERFTVIMIF